MTAPEPKTVDLTRYVSNLDQNVYAIFNLPEEVIAVIFAYVSRSPASFRDNLKKLLADEELAVGSTAGGMATVYSEKAAKFHEKWVVGYGHSSVAEHAVAHLGIEKISRLASAELELANTFNSFTEYSQRYQRPERGSFYIPPELDEHPEAKEAFIRLNEEVYDVYEQLLQGLIPHLAKKLPRQEGESGRRHQLRIEKIAFEDARYVLTLATQTSLGLTGNGRSLRDTLVRLLSSRYEETRRLARDMEREISKVIPTLLKHVQPSEYILETRRELEERTSSSSGGGLRGEAFEGPRARFTGMPDYEEAIDTCCVHLGISLHNQTYEQAVEQTTRLPLEEKEKIVEAALKHLRFFDHPLDAFRHLFYHMEMQISEANWHQLLRHNRGTHFSHGQPTVELGYTIPPHIREAGLSDLFSRAIRLADQIHDRVASVCPAAAPYCVTNAHHRQITATANLWEMYHLINLRTSPEAQWDIRETFQQLFEEMKNKHPALVRFAQRRL